VAGSTGALISSVRDYVVLRIGRGFLRGERRRGPVEESHPPEAPSDQIGAQFGLFDDPLKGLRLLRVG